MNSRQSLVLGGAAAAYLALFLIPYILVGPNDLEEFYTGILSTKLAVDAILAGQWPFWTPNLGFGVPLPLKYDFTTHPLGLLCGAIDCSAVLRIITSIQIVLGVLCMGAILRKGGVGPVLSACGALAYVVTSSTVQYTYVNDWSSTGVNEASIPILVFAAMQVLDGSDRRTRLLWSLVFGGVAGQLSAMGYAVPQLLVVVPFILARPAVLWARRGWFALAAAVTVGIGGGHLYHLAEQVLLTPPTVPRGPHVDPTFAAQLWSTFLRPFGTPRDASWRIIFLGPPFAVLAAIGLFDRRPQLWPLQVGLAASVLLLVLPEQYLFNLVTARWFFSAGVNVYGLLLATHVVARLERSRPRRVARAAATAIVLTQFAWQWQAFWPNWRAVARVAIGYPEQDPSSRRVADARPAVERLRELTATNGGRLLLSLGAHREVRTLRLTKFGLAPNIFAMHGVPTVDGIAHGIVVDAFFPTDGLTSGPIHPPPDAALDQAFLDVLGIRYVLVQPDERVAPTLRDHGLVAGGLRLLENPAAWPLAFLVDELPKDRLPRKPRCGHDRLLCADFSAYPLNRRPEPIAVERRHDGVTLTFSPAAEPRLVVLTYWNQPGWRVSPATVEIAPVMEQFIGLEIPAGESTVTLTYFPIARGAVFLASVGLEIAVAALCVFIVSRRTRGLTR